MKILTVISNFNEEGAVGNTIRDIRDNSPLKSDLLVIDNCSSDDSINVIRSEGADYLIHAVNSGSSAGVIKSALAYAYRYGFDIYCHMDGDNQHLAAELGKIVLPVLNGEADVVVGSRFLEDGGFRSSYLRRRGIFLFSCLTTLVTGNRYTDITSGFRAYNRKAIEFFAGSFRQEIDTITQLELAMHYAGLRRIEVPVRMRARKTGRSEFNFRNTVKFPVYNIIGLLGTVIQNNGFRKKKIL
ncbi:MAG: glycosyltransferase family 2 protein [Bacteroidales bacterium]|nr:glycosyltransferase family 2 protein [Bacteroidales bacterium]